MLFAARDVSRETSPAAKSEEKRMFSQARSVAIHSPLKKEKETVLSQRPSNDPRNNYGTQLGSSSRFSFLKWRMNTEVVPHEI